MSQQRDKVLRWYPPAWRGRYGDELLAMIEDESGASGTTLGSRVSLKWCGVRERLHEAGLVGSEQPSSQRIRAGSLLILGAWSGFTLAGISFSKATEHFSEALRPVSRSVPQDAFDLVAILGIAGAVCVLIGIVVAVPEFIRFLRAGGWTHLRGYVVYGTLVSVVAVAGIVGLSEWGRHLTVAQRNGAGIGYSAAFVAVAILATLALGAWTAAGVVAARRMEFSSRLLRIEAALAVGVAVSMVAITIGAATWWGAMARNAPWFLEGTARGTDPSPFTVQLVVTLAVMLAAACSSVYGVVRIVRPSSPPTPF